MLFNADILQNFTLKDVNFEKIKISKRNFRQNVENMKHKLTLTLD